MTVVRTKLIPLGRHESPEGTVDVTRERVAGWVERESKLRSDGVKFPVSWGHQLSAMPMESGSVDESAFTAAKFNAGYFTRLIQADDGGLDAEIEAPGLQLENGQLVSVATLPGTNVPVKTAIGEVSAMIGPWTDGKGRRHDDLINHIALTPLPVVAGQKGFEPAQVALSTKRPRSDSGFVCLSTQTRLATDDKSKDKDEAKPAEVAEDLLKPAPEDETPAGETIPDAASEPQRDPEVEQIKTALAELGCPLPADTTGETFKRDLLVALTVLAGKVKKDESDAAAQQATNEPAERPREIPPPAMMMSTLRQSPALMQLATDDAEAKRQARLGKIDELVKRNLPPTVAAELKTVAGQKLLSIDPRNGQRITLRIDRELELLDKVLPAADSSQALLSTARVGESPINEPAGGHATAREGLGNDLPLTDAEYAEISRRTRSATGRTK